MYAESTINTHTYATHEQGRVEQGAGGEGYAEVSAMCKTRGPT